MSLAARPSSATRWPCRLAALALLLTAGCHFDLPGKPREADKYIRPQQEMRFSILFQQNCAGCHGANGQMGPAPPLNDPLFRALVPDAELLRVITEGRSGTLMPAFAITRGGLLTAEQVKVLAEGIKTHWGPAGPIPSGAPPYLAQGSKPEALPPAAGQPEVIAVPPRPVEPDQPDGARAGNNDAGAKVFARACASCHGDHGQGGKTVGAINDPNFLALISDQALRRIVITGRSDLGMPSYTDPKGRPEGFQPLTPEEVTAVTALLASWRQGGSLNEKGN